MSYNKNIENPLGSNKSLAGLFEPLIAKLPKASSPVSMPKALETAQYSQQNLDQIIHIFFQTLKDGSFGDQLKAKSFDVYCNKSYM